MRNGLGQVTRDNETQYLPSVDVVHDCLRRALAMFQLEVVEDPLDEMVLEAPLDNLVEEVG